MRPVVHASLSQDMVNRLIAWVAEDDYVPFERARQRLERRWAEEARQRIVANLSTYLMWEEMTEMARNAVPPARAEGGAA